LIRGAGFNATFIAYEPGRNAEGLTSMIAADDVSRHEDIPKSQAVYIRRVKKHIKAEWALLFGRSSATNDAEHRTC
jgi:hypothetical protein